MKILVVVYATGRTVQLICNPDAADDVITMYLRYVRKDRDADDFCTLLTNGKLCTVLQFRHIASMLIKDSEDG